ncbi:unnamed protein product, partial [Urochloa humidicola]
KKKKRKGKTPTIDLEKKSPAAGRRHVHGVPAAAPTASYAIVGH